MKDRSENSLAEQREWLRTLLQKHREQMAEKLAPGGDSVPEFPRSLLMRMLIDRPAVLIRLLSLFSGTRLATALATLLGVARLLLALKRPQGPKALAGPPPLVTPASAPKPSIAPFRSDRF